jgi:hypothetical protein
MSGGGLRGRYRGLGNGPRIWVARQSVRPSSPRCRRMPPIARATPKPSRPCTPFWRFTEPRGQIESPRAEPVGTAASRAHPPEAHPAIPQREDAWAPARSREPRPHRPSRLVRRGTGSASPRRQRLTPGRKRIAAVVLDDCERSDEPHGTAPERGHAAACHCGCG